MKVGGFLRPCARSLNSRERIVRASRTVLKQLSRVTVKAKRHALFQKLANRVLYGVILGCVRIPLLRSDGRDFRW